MLPKKRKFDLSKFELDRGEAGGPGTSHGLAPGPGPGGGSVTVTSADRPGHQQRPPRPPEVRALPASGFLTPETVHEAFAGNSYLKPASASSSREARSLMSGPGPPPTPRSGSSPGSSLSNTIVDLSHKQSDKHRSSVSVSVTPGPLSQYSAFSRHLPFPGALARLQPELVTPQSTQSFKRVAPAQPSGPSGPGDPGGVSVVLEPAVSASHKTKPGPAPQHRWAEHDNMLNRF